MTKAAEEGEARIEARDVAREQNPPSGLPRQAVLSWLLGVAVLAGLIAVVLRFGDLEIFIVTIRAANPLWLAIAIILQAGTYGLAAGVWSCVLRRGDAPQPFRSLLALAVLQLFANQAVPIAGLSGNVMVMHGLVRRGVPAPIAMTALLISALSYYAAYLLAGLLAFVLLWHRGDLNAAWLSLCAVFVVVVVALALLVLILSRWREGRLPARLVSWRMVASLSKLLQQVRTDMLGDVRLIFETVFLQAGVFALDALTLWCACYATGLNIDFDNVFMSFALASIVASLSLIPLGLGSFEATCVGMLHVAGASLEASLAATLILRGLTLWLPMVPGFLLTRYEKAVR